MRRFRLFLAWLIVAAIPLQGLAASSMLFCGMGGHHAPARASAPQAQPASGHAGTDAAHDHSRHTDATGLGALAADEGPGMQLPGAGHKCAVCASCCNIVGLAEAAQPAAFAPAPKSEWAEPFVLIRARPAQVPDKPPRA